MKDYCVRSLASRADHQERLEKLTGGKSPFTCMIPQTPRKVKAHLTKKNNELLALADYALQEYRDAWALFIATGDDAAYIAAMAAKQDREALLAQVGGDCD